MPRKKRGPYLKIQRSGIWAICWLDPGSRAVRSRTTGETDRVRADEVLARYLAAVDGKQAPADATVREILESYAQELQPRRTWPKHRSKLRWAAKHLGWLRWGELRPRHGMTYAAARRGEGAAQGTIAQELAMLQVALNRHGSMHLLPVVQVQRVQRPEPRDRWLTENETDKLLAACEIPHIRLFVMLALHTGARTEAILELTWTKVDLDGLMIDYGKGTGTKHRARVPINEDLADALREARAMRTANTVIEWHGKSIRRIGRTVSAAARLAGIEHCSPHDLRRTAGSRMLQRGVKIEVVSRVLGHRSIRTTEKVYAFLGVEDLRAAVAQLVNKRT